MLLKTVMKEVLVTKKFGTPVPGIAIKEICSGDLQEGESVPDLDWEISEETIKKIDEIEEFIRKGLMCMRSHPELFRLGSLTRA